MEVLRAGNGVCDRRAASAVEVPAEVRVDDHAGASDDQQGRVLGVFQRVGEEKEAERDPDVQQAKPRGGHQRQY